MNKLVSAADVLARAVFRTVGRPVSRSDRPARQTVQKDRLRSALVHYLDERSKLDGVLRPCLQDGRSKGTDAIG